RLTYHQLYTQTAALQALIDQLRQFTGLNSELLLLQWFYQWINEEICL
ncbi:MAG: DNA polymerase III subunit delta' C-terminal domain-containing protein, partial [Vibrio sp.]